MRFWQFDFSVVTVTFSILLLSSALQSAARDVRPSDHGLQYQQSRPAGENASPPEMCSFFGASSTPPIPPNSSTLPKASNSTDSSWMQSSGSSRRRRVREILLVASLVCGVTGLALLIGSALLFLVKFQKEIRSPQMLTSSPQQPPRPAQAAGAHNCTI
ncbi:hypothetical protein SAY86_012984 [Trapa natans]|uniref:Uncharacterized protein n=1 Tax=Trapa natans TaxID=22666 RepID=A0AAN7RB63_TRANT|nr:hypothetical protein SAY86_012984 [Trapa natans]